MMSLDFSKVKVIDLSRPVSPMKNTGPDDFATACLEECIVWPYEQYASYVDHSIYQVVKLKTHVKTHIETPYHHNQVGRPISGYGADTFIGRMVNFCFDVEPGAQIDAKMVEAADRGRVRRGDIVVMRTTIDESLQFNGIASGKVPMPILTPDAARWLVEKGIKLFGLDASIDIGTFVGETRSHDVLLENDVPLLEFLTNLDQLTQDVSFLVAVPGFLKFEGIDASPTPAVALEGIEVL